MSVTLNWVYNKWFVDCDNCHETEMLNVAPPDLGGTQGKADNEARAKGWYVRLRDGKAFCPLCKAGAFK